ncbi:YlbE-like family protein [Camelliibacillus cellulosilyticus]|uniref:YlbE-like family protein n=1 Tax=Camelliibacillus cellulosilyticus TaxID=2174486 RepID=A0ABV9GI65_9BACL
MRAELIRYLDTRPDIRHFIRMNPEWYRKLARDPRILPSIHQKVDDFFGRTLEKRVERFADQLNMLNLLMDLVIMTGEQKKEAP